MSRSRNFHSIGDVSRERQQIVTYISKHFFHGFEGTVKFLYRGMGRRPGKLLPEAEGHYAVRVL